MLSPLDLYKFQMMNQTPMPAQLPSIPAYEGTSGAEMEADSRSSIDKILERMTSSREADRQNDRNLQWMTFFSKLASSKSPSFLGSAGEAADALSETTGKQAQANKLLDKTSMEDELKLREWQQEQDLKERQLDQGKYTITADGLGGFLKINNKTGETETVNNPASSTLASPSDASGNPLTGEDYLKTLDPRIAKTAKMVADGDMPWPGGFALKSPYWQNVIAAAQTYDPTTNGNRFPAVKSFNTGKQGDQIRAFDVGLSHLGTLSTLVDALENKDVQLMNKATNSWKEQTGSPAPTNFNAAKEVVGNEIVKAIVGAGGGVADREKAQKSLDDAKSPTQLKGVIDTYKNLMGGQLGGLKQQYENATGRKDFLKRLSPNARAEASRLLPDTNATAPDAKDVSEETKKIGNDIYVKINGDWHKKL